MVDEWHMPMLIYTQTEISDFLQITLTRNQNNQTLTKELKIIKKLIRVKKNTHKCGNIGVEGVSDKRLLLKLTLKPVKQKKNKSKKNKAKKKTNEINH
nr:hypothetical protein [Mycoplasmopsis bovis]